MKNPDHPINDRQIRVFISSTFRDMQAERDYLVKFIFPQLRKLCESRGVTWGEVDLRWGVTDEQAAEGKVLPICLEEIKRCRPYFIGLLGERYGWIPDAIPEDVIEREPWLNEHLHGKKSVTELEILHGVLREEKMHGHAFFYFRDPAFINTVPPDKRPDFVTEDAASAEKLRLLKETIRHAQVEQVCVLRENYPTPEALGELVLTDLTKIINDTWPEGSQPDPLDREAMDHDAYAQSRERVYIGRQEYFDCLDAYASGDDATASPSPPTGVGGEVPTPRPRERERVAEGRVRADAEKQTPAGEVGIGNKPLCILGESGSGKSALLANWVARYRQAHPDIFVLQHYIGATPYSADWAAMLRRLMGEFKRRLGIQQDIPDQPDALRSAFPNWLYMAAAKGRVVLVLDALNQLEDRDGAPDLVWLPPVMPENVRLIVSTLPGRPLDEIQKRNGPTLKVELLSTSERRKLIAEYLAQHAKSLSPERVERIAATPQSANPLYLRVLLDELRLVRTHEELEERISDYLKAESPYALYGKVIARWEQDYRSDSDLVADTLTLLWAARRGLTETELLRALGKEGEPLPRAKWSPLFLTMSDALVSRGGLLTFAHDFLRTATRDTFVLSDTLQQQAHLRVADFFQAQPACPRRTDELPWQLAEAKAWQRLQTLLTDRVFLAGAWDENEFEVKAFWKQIEGESPLRMVEAYRELIERPEMESDTDHLWRLGLLLDDTGHPDEALRCRTVLAAHFRSSGDLSALEGALGNQAMILAGRRDLDGAMALYKEQERICRQLGKLDSLAICLANQGSSLRKSGNREAAMALYKEAEKLSRDSDRPDIVQFILGNQAQELFRLGNLEDAMALSKEQERICRMIGNMKGIASSLAVRAQISFKHGDLDEATAIHKEEERICRELGDTAGLASSLRNQAEILSGQGDLAGAQALDMEVEQIYRQLGWLTELGFNLLEQANILAKRGDINGAMALYKEQEQICRQTGLHDFLAVSLHMQAELLSKCPGYGWQARANCAEAMRLYKALGKNDLWLNARTLRLQLCLGSGRSVRFMRVWVGLLPFVLCACAIGLGFWSPWLWILGGPLAVVSIFLIVLRLRPQLNTSLVSRLLKVCAKPD